MSQKEAPKMYFFKNFSFAVPANGATYFRSEVLKLENPNVTARVIASLKEAIKIPQQSVLISVSDLGCMTEEEFMPVQVNGMEATEAYLEGLTVGTGSVHAENPYPLNTKEFLDWRNGRIQGEEIKKRQQQEAPSE